MFKKLRKAIRRFRKDFMDDVRHYSLLKAILKLNPYYYRVNNIYWWFKHRTFSKYHIIKTDLKPNYYDIDTLLVHGCFSLLVRFVEDEHGGLDKLKEHIEMYREGKKADEPIISDHKYDYDSAIANYEEVVRLYLWWKNEYPKYDKDDPFEVEYTSNPQTFSLHDRLKPCSWDDDGDPTMFELVDNKTPEEKEKWKNIMDASHEFHKNKEQTITDNMTSLVKLRTMLWT